MKIEFERFHFAEGQIEKVEREIDAKKVLAGNAFFQMLSKKQCSRENSSISLKTR